MVFLCLGATGQADQKGGSFADLAVNHNGSVVPGNDAVHHGQTQSGSLFLQFGGKKRIKNFANVFSRITAPGIGNGNLYGLQRSAAYAHRQKAAVRHRLGGVDQHIQQHLLHLPEIGADAQIRFHDLFADGDVLQRKLMTE